MMYKLLLSPWFSREVATSLCSVLSLQLTVAMYVSWITERNPVWNKRINLGFRVMVQEVWLNEGTALGSSKEAWPQFFPFIRLSAYPWFRALGFRTTGRESKNEWRGVRYLYYLSWTAFLQTRSLLPLVPASRNVCSRRFVSSVVSPILRHRSRIGILVYN